LFVETPALAMAPDMTFDQFVELEDEPDHFERPCHANLSHEDWSPNSRSGRGSSSPRPEGFLSEDAERTAGCEMALDVESVLDGGVNGQEALG
jgi:hypothetical protein